MINIQFRMWTHTRMWNITLLLLYFNTHIPTTYGMSPNILPLHLLCVSSTTILLHSTLLQPSYYTLQYYNQTTTLYINTIYNLQDEPHRINRGRSLTATPGLHQSTATPGLHQYTATLRLIYRIDRGRSPTATPGYTTATPGPHYWSHHSCFPRYAL